MSGYVCHEHFERNRRERFRLTCDHEDQGCSFNGTACCRSCFEQAKVDYEVWYKAQCAEEDACPACQTAKRQAAERRQRYDTIDPDQPWGEHIRLTCVNHPDLRWFTKNISHIGARSIFFEGWDRGQKECPCPMRDLRVVEVEEKVTS